MEIGVAFKTELHIQFINYSSEKGIWQDYKKLT